MSYRQAENLAKLTHTAFGYLFLDRPPEEKLPIPEFRTAGSKTVGTISPDLRDVIYQSERRQDWYRDFQKEQGAEALSFVGSFPAKISDSYIAETAQAIRKTLAYHPGQSKESQLAPVLKEFSEAVEAARILVVRAGKVGNNTRRLLDPQEFRGFALVDPLAPLVFINTADTKAAQIFSLAHELAHVWAGESALSNLKNTYASAQKNEQFCNAVAAEYLVPLVELKNILKREDANDPELVRKLRLRYRVSDLVIIRRLHDAGIISRETFRQRYQNRLAEYARKKDSDGGGNFNNNQPNQIGKQFGTALVSSTLEGRTLYREALSLLDMKKESSFKTFARNLNFPD